jgi:hypothetical protein
VSDHERPVTLWMPTSRSCVELRTVSRSWGRGEAWKVREAGERRRERVGLDRTEGLVRLEVRTRDRTREVISRNWRCSSAVACGKIL